MICVLASEAETLAVIKEYALMSSKDIHFYKKYSELEKVLPESEVVIVDADDQEGMIDVRKIKNASSKANVIIVAKDTHSILEANELFVSGYLLKPLTYEKLDRQFRNLRVTGYR